MTLDINLLSKYRTQLMGIATVWVLLFHFNYYMALPYIGYIKWIGYGGVDIFLLLSGIGAFTSLNKDSSTNSFYKRRLLRILPIYLPIMLIFTLTRYCVGTIDLSDVLLNITTLGFWINHKYVNDWYIPSLLALYFITPIFIHLFQSRMRLAVAIGCVLCIIISIALIGTNFAYLLIFTTRIPIFLIGILIGHELKQKTKVSFAFSIVLLIALAVGWSGLYYITRHLDIHNMIANGTAWYPFIFITLPLSLLLASGMAYFPKYKYYILTFLGTYSLSIYLFYQRLIVLQGDVLPLTESSSIIIVNLIIVIATLFISYFYQNFVTKLVNNYINKRKQLPK